MLVMILCHDKPDAGPIRAANREDHLRYVADAGDRLKLAGPIQSTDGQGPEGGARPVGSLLIIEAASLEAARLFADNDPYRKAGVFAEVEVRPFKGVLGAWLPDAG